MKRQLLFIGVMIASLFMCIESLCNAHEAIQSIGPKLELSANKKTFVLLEPIALTFKITSVPSQPLAAQSSENPRYGRLYAVASSERGVEEIPGFSLDPNSSILIGGVEAGRTQELQLMFVPSERKRLMLVGKYQIRAKLEIKPNIIAESAPITIEIREPGGLDLEAGRYIRSKGLPAYFFEGLLTMPEGREQGAVWAEAINNLEEFVSRYGETSYGDYATLTLGGFYFHQMEYWSAISTLERLADKDEFPRLDSVLTTLAASYVRLGNTAKAKEELEKLKFKRPNSELIKVTEYLIRQ